jgi:hypothetical protein
VRPWLERLPGAGWPTREVLNALAGEAQLRTASGMPVRFVEPSSADPYYEVQVHRTGRVATRTENWHDLFNALAWLAFPRTKAAINALHAAEIPREGARRGRVRDMLTLFDEGGAIVLCADPELERMIRAFRWKELFWENRIRVLRSLRFVVLGHAVLEKALAPWPGIACKAIFTRTDEDPDAAAARWLETPHAPHDLAPLPVFGYPGWLAENANAGFYADERYFRPFRRRAS